MFPHAELTPDEASRLAGLVSVSEDGRRLLQPCRALSGLACAVYESRPAVCRAYRCLALRQLEAGEATVQEAREAIVELKARRDAVVALVGGAPGDALARARAQVAAGDAPPELASAVERLHRVVLLLQWEPPTKRR